MAFEKLHKTFCSCGFEKGKRKQFFVLLCILRETHILFFMLVLACNYPQLFEEEAVWWTIVLKLRNLVCWVINYVNDLAVVTSVQFSSVTQSCPTLWDPMNCSMPGLPVHHQLPEFTQNVDGRVGLWRKLSAEEIDAFEVWCRRRLLRVPWTARRSNQSILKEISPGISLEGLMLQLKLQYFGHLMRRVDSLEKTLMLGGIGGREEKGMTEDEMAGWHHRLNGHESEWTPGVGDGQGGLVCCDSWGHKESDMIERLNWTGVSTPPFSSTSAHLLVYLPSISCLKFMAYPLAFLASRLQDFPVTFSLSIISLGLI